MEHVSLIPEYSGAIQHQRPYFPDKQALRRRSLFGQALLKSSPGGITLSLDNDAFMHPSARLNFDNKKTQRIPQLRQLTEAVSSSPLLSMQQSDVASHQQALPQAKPKHKESLFKSLLLAPFRLVAAPFKWLLPKKAQHKAKAQPEVQHQEQIKSRFDAFPGFLDDPFSMMADPFSDGFAQSFQQMMHGFQPLLQQANQLQSIAQQVIEQANIPSADKKRLANGAFSSTYIAHNLNGSPQQSFHVSIPFLDEKP